MKKMLENKTYVYFWNYINKIIEKNKNKLYDCIFQRFLNFIGLWTTNLELFSVIYFIIITNLKSIQKWCDCPKTIEINIIRFLFAKKNATSIVDIVIIIVI